jgi:hypothetical protein
MRYEKDPPGRTSFCARGQLQSGEAKFHSVMDAGSVK